jgi:hypothetical protein
MHIIYQHLKLEITLASDSAFFSDRPTHGTHPNSSQNIELCTVVYYSMYTWINMTGLKKYYNYLPVQVTYL